MANCNHSCCNSAHSGSCSHDHWPHGGCGCFFPPWMHGACCSLNNDSACPYSCWRHPIYCTPSYYTCAETENGPTLVIHQIVLEAGGEQSCTPRTFRIRVTGPSYPCGEIFTLRTGSCTELDEPLVISGLQPGQYQIEILYDCPRDYATTITGPVCSGVVTVTNNTAPTVVTIVSRRRIRRCRCHCGCSRNCTNW